MARRARAGIAAADRRLIIIWDRAHPRESHLIAVVRVELRWLIMDEGALTLVDSTAKPTYEPLHSFDAIVVGESLFDQPSKLLALH